MERGFTPAAIVRIRNYKSKLVRGFTLLELMVAVAILLIVITGLLTAFINCILLNESNNNLVKAANDAQYVLEQIKALAYTDISAYSYPTFNNLPSETITLTRPGSISDPLRTITVAVSWQERTQTRSFSLATYFAK